MRAKINKFAMEVKIKVVREGAKIPERQTAGSSGFDLFACFDKPEDLGLPKDVLESQSIRSLIILKAGDRVLIPTGISMELPIGWEAQIRSRSGLTLKQGLHVLNSPGTIDSDYRGEIGVIIKNSSNESQVIKTGDRIAQIVICPVVVIDEIVEVDSLSDTARGEGGFGSTGKA